LMPCPITVETIMRRTRRERKETVLGAVLHIPFLSSLGPWALEEEQGVVVFFIVCTQREAEKKDGVWLFVVLFCCVVQE
jgi:hypothetical protein